MQWRTGTGHGHGEIHVDSDRAGIGQVINSSVQVYSVRNGGKGQDMFKS